MDWQGIESALDEALDVPVAQRRAWLADRYRADPTLLKELVSLLDAAEQATAFLEPESRLDPVTLQPGMRFGVWKIVGSLGRGGMGEVYRVERDDGEYQQTAALKLMRGIAGTDRDRFMAERQIVAGLEHPGIARILDGGLGPDGQPFMVQEFVDGPAIDSWCAREDLGPAERTRLMLDVCEAVSHAHAKLTVHRDIKPSNILVAEGGRTRLIDFGVAQKLGDGASRADPSPVSIEYSAPEVVEGQMATVMSDVYGLAATLFDLIAGRPPIDVGTLPFPAAIRRIVDQSPDRLVAALPPGVRPSGLVRDLDAVLDRALSKSPTARYGTVEAFADDLRRALEGSAVTVRREERGYVARRFLKRRWLPVSAAAAVVLSLSGGLAIALDQAAVAQRERDAALLEQSRLQAVQNYLYFMLRTGAETGGPDADASRILDAAAAQVLDQFQADPQRGGPVARMLGELYFYMNDYEAAKPLLERLMTVRGVDPAIVAGAAYDLAQIKERQAEPEEARALMLRAQSFWNTDPRRWRSELVDSRLTEARLLRDAGDAEGAIRVLRANLPARIAISGPNHRDTGVYHNDLGVMLTAAGRTEEAVPSFQAALAVWSTNGLENGPDALNTLNNLAALEVLSGRPARAEPLFRRAVEVRRKLYGPSAATAALLSNYGKTLMQLDRHAEALPFLREATEMARVHAGVASLHYASAVAGLSEASLATGRAGEAARLSEGAVSEVEAALGPDHPATAIVRIALARVRAAQGRKAEAGRLLDAAQVTLAALGPGAASQIKAIDQIRARYGLDRTAP